MSFQEGQQLILGVSSSGMSTGVIFVMASSHGKPLGPTAQVLGVSILETFHPIYLFLPQPQSTRRVT